MAMEFTACTAFHFIGSVSPTPVANGIALVVLVYYAAKVSGAHLNPAVTLVFTMLGHVHPIEMLAYWASQLAGCITGALWILALVPGAAISPRSRGFYGDGCFSPDTALVRGQVFGWEALCTMMFMLPIFSVVWYTQEAKGYKNGPLFIGLALLANALACGPYTGAALNPARALGSVVVFGCPYKHIFVDYVLAELTGAAVSVLLIAPWYGIAAEAWYLDYVTEPLYHAVVKNHNTIVIKTVQPSDPLPPAVSRRRTARSLAV